MCLFWGDFCRPVLAAGSAWLHFWTQKDLEICEQNSCLLLPGCVEISCLQNFYVTGGDSKRLPHHFPEEWPRCVVFRTTGLWLFVCLCPSAFLGLPYSVLLWSTCGLSVWCYSQLLCVKVRLEEPGRQCLGVAWKDDAMKTGVCGQIAWVPTRHLHLQALWFLGNFVGRIYIYFNFMFESIGMYPRPFSNL